MDPASTEGKSIWMSALKGSDPELTQIPNDCEFLTSDCDDQVKFAALCNGRFETKETHDDTKHLMVKTEIVSKNEDETKVKTKPCAMKASGERQKAKAFVKPEIASCNDPAKQQMLQYVKHQSIFLVLVMSAIFLYVFSLTLMFLLVTFFSLYFNLGASLLVFTSMLFFPMSAAFLYWNFFVFHSTIFVVMTASVLFYCLWLHVFGADKFAKLGKTICAFLTN